MKAARRPAMSPEIALASLREHTGLALIDLDETLYLRNSTEDFIDLARPATLALVLLRLLDGLQPWRWSGGVITRDCWRVMLVMFVFPWTLWRWRQCVPELARQYGNRPLIEALEPRRSIIITDGFAPIVNSLVDALGIEARVLATRPAHFSDRSQGKLARAQSALGEDAVANSLVLTDSMADLPLLQACAKPLHTVWPEASFRPALAAIYLPGQYISQVKRPGERYVLRAILQEDYGFWLIATVALAEAPLLHALGLLCLLLSFWTVYERGYLDNDRCAALYEVHPKLHPHFHAASAGTPSIAPWLWAIVSGAAGVGLLAPSVLGLLAWASLLLTMHLTFLAYNRLDKMTRRWLYPFLQLTRSTAPLVLVPVTPIGAMALAAHALARSLPYFTYRSGAQEWPEIPLHLVRLQFFLILACLLGAFFGWSSLVTPTAAVLLVWCVFRARRDLQDAFSRAYRIDRSVEYRPSREPGAGFDEGGGESPDVDAEVKFGPSRRCRPSLAAKPDRNMSDAN